MGLLPTSPHKSSLTKAETAPPTPNFLKQQQVTTAQAQAQVMAAQIELQRQQQAQITVAALTAQQQAALTAAAAAKKQPGKLQVYTLAHPLLHLKKRCEKARFRQIFSTCAPDFP